MSILTKTFVMLLVVLSLVETAGIIVYVNQSHYFSKSLAAQHAELMAAKAEAGTLRDAAALAQNERISAAAEANAIRTSSAQQIDGLRAAMLEKDTALAAANNNVLQLTAGQKSTSDALLAMQKSNDMQNQQMADLRKSSLELQKRDSENSLALVALNNKFDTVNRQWRDATEMNTELQNQLRGANETMKKLGLNDKSPTINQEAMVKVAGVIRRTENVNGVKMATISVGSADQVTKGMRFAVIDRNSSDPFLGYLIVDTLEPNSAIGTLTGPRVDQIHAGVEVRTQL